MPSSEPEAESRTELVLDLAEEFLERYRKGERPPLKEYIDRHPELAAEIKEVFPAMAMMENIAVADESAEGKPPELATGHRGRESLTQLGDYRIIREIGRGGMGVVYEAEQVSLGRHVALKVLPNQALADAKHKRRFERESKAAAKLHHTNIVPVFGVGEHEGLPYYVMQFIQGLGLDTVLDELNRMQPGATAVPTGLPTAGEIRVARRDLSAADMARSLMTGEFQPSADDVEVQADPKPTNNITMDQPAAGTANAPAPSQAHSDTGRLSDSFTVSSSSIALPGSSGAGRKAAAKKQTYWHSVANIGRQVADALEYAHKQGILHRDIKPSNLLLDLRGTMWVTDFGLAKVAGPGAEDITHTGDLLGTLRYMPPEAFEGKSDACSDVYALGMTLYELLAMRPAFAEKDRNKLIKQVTTGEPAPLDKVRPEVPRDLVTIIQKSIAREPSRRYATAEELATDLQRFLDDEPILARRQTQLERYWRWARHNPGIAVLGGVLTALLVVVTVVSLLAAGYFNRLHLNEAQAAQSERDARHEAELARQAAKTLAKTEAEANALAQQERQRAEKALAEADKNRKLLQIERDEGRQKLYFAEMTLAGIAAEAPGGLGRVQELLAPWGPASPGPDLRGWEWYYLDSQSRQAALTLRGHAGPVNAVAYSHDGKRLATGGDDTTARIWDTATAREIICLRGHSKAVRGVAWSPDGSRLATASHDGTARIWDVATGLELRQLGKPGPPINAVAWRSDGARLAITGNDYTVHVWDPDTGKEVIAPKVSGGWGMSLAWSPDGKKIACGSWDYEARVIDGETGAVLGRLTGHTNSALGMSWSPTGDRLATASWDRTVRLWDAKTAKQLAVLPQAEYYLFGVCWSPDGKQIAAGGGNRAVQIWDVETKKPRTVLRGNQGDVTALAWSPDGGSLAATSPEGITRIWDVRPGSAQAPSRIPPDWARVTISPDGKWRWAHEKDQPLLIHDAASGTLLQTISDIPNKIIWQTRWSPDSTRIAGSMNGHASAVWDAQTGKRLCVMSSPRSGRHFALAWSRAGDRIATGNDLGSIHIWDPATGKLLREIKCAAEVWDLSWSPDDRHIVAARWDGLATIWDTSTGAEGLTLRGHSGRVIKVGWSPDGKRIATGSYDRTVKLWDPITGRETLTLRGHTGAVREIHWRPDGGQLATRGESGPILYWDATPAYLAERS